MDVAEYVKLQDNTIAENKKQYYTKDGVTYINIVECDRMYWNATSIIEFLIDDMNGVDNKLSHLSFSSLNNLLCRIINRGEIAKADKKIKEWIVRNNRNWCSENNKEFNKLIRSNYVFYYDNRHGTLYR